MTSIETEVHVQPARDYISDLFVSPPDDKRFSKVAYEKFLPVTSVKNYRDLQADPAINFHLPKKTAPFVYLLSQTLVSVKLKIVDSNGALPASNAKVCLVNNILHSLFSSCEVKLNLTPVSVSNMYNYRSYIQTVLTYGRATARSPLECSGYFPDLPKHFDNYAASSGHVSRAALFRKDLTNNGDFAPDGCVFTGRVLHELVSCQKFIPPDWQIDFTFVRSSDQFVLFQDPSDTKTYKIYLQDIILYIPVATLTTQCLGYLNARFPKQPINFNFRKLVVCQHNVLKTKSYRCMNILGTNSGIYPTRVFIVFIENRRREGNVNLNPYLFARSWKYTSSLEYEDKLAHHQHLIDRSYVEKLESGFIGYLKREKLKKQLRKERQRRKKTEEKLKNSAPKEPVPSTSGGITMKKGRGRKKAGNETNDDPDYVVEDSSSSTDSSDLLDSDNSDIFILKGFENELRKKSVERHTVSESGSFKDARSSNSIQLEDGFSTEKEFEIQSIRLLLQGTPVDNLESIQASNTATNDFLRLYRTCAMMNSTYTNGKKTLVFHNKHFYNYHYECFFLPGGLTLSDFLFGYGIFGYDLTTSQSGGLGYYSTPGVLMGVLSCEVEFSSPVPEAVDLEMLIFAEINTSIQLKHDGSIQMSTSVK